MKEVIIQLFGELKFVAGLTFIGWALAIYCIWDKWDPKKEKVIHLISNIITATFTSITFLLAVSITWNLTIQMPELRSVIKKQDEKLSSIEEALPKPEDIRKNLDPKFKSLSDLVITTGEKTPEEIPITLSEEIKKVYISNRGKIEDSDFQKIIDLYFMGLDYWEEEHSHFRVNGISGYKFQINDGIGKVITE